MRLILAALCLLLALPVAAILGSWLLFDAAALATLAHQASTVLPGYALQSLALAAGVGLGVALVGVGAAVVVSLFRFPGRAVFEWALLLPMAMPGYVLAKLNMTDDVYHLVKNTPKVTGFLGSGNKPQPISEKEASRYFGGVAEAQAAPKRDISVDYEIGDSVKVLDGPFASFNGIVEELDFDKAKVKVGVSIFGRATPVELDFEQVELAK